ncbi:winged helix-turn-helix domain-containing protein [Methanohalobium sp.]|uniref:winged helix-turn-helix domain-containing protein n=1 Tax=Methanohalobium sp. TaxID=2837493 RepID=UPI0025F60D8E|nr:winged helix-turn-helix domain-containing protein [Methanohalobium sp.]
MSTVESEYKNELQEIKEEISSMRKEFNRFFEYSNQQYLEQILQDMKNNFSRILIDYVVEDSKNSLDENMIQDCKMKNFCESIFNDFLQGTAQLLNNDSVDPETIEQYYEQFNELKKEKAKYPKCETCFSEASKLFEKQVNLMRSLKIYEKEDDKEKIQNLPVEEVVKDVCDPIANKQRLTILKSIATDTKSFTQLSKLTGLNGGNLLFHLDKLLNTGMIQQISERGDYIITGKGYAALKGISNVYSQIKL